MKILTGFLFSLNFIFLLTACSDDEIEFDEYIIGVVYGHCIGDCTHLYKLHDGNLYPDALDFYDPEKLVFQSEAMNKNDAAKVHLLMIQTPEQLIKTSESRIACPDCYDQGSLLVRFTRRGLTKEVFLDPDLKKNDYPELFEFVSSLKLILEDLRS